MKKIYSPGILMVIFFIVSVTSGTALNLQKTEKRDVGDFSKIGLKVNADLFLKQGKSIEIVIEAKDEVLKKLKTEVKNDKLYIGFDSWRYANYPRFKIYITMPEIDGLSVSGSGDIIAKSPIKAEEISLKISGSGNINMDDLEARMVDSGISGSGNIELAGNSMNQVELSISGSGNFIGEDLETENFDAKISGSGSCRIHATAKIKASISGSGRIYYTGNPVLDARISGSGKIISIK